MTGYRRVTESVAYINGFRIGRLVPGGIKRPDTAREIGTIAIEGLDIGRVLGNSIVNGINGFDEFLDAIEMT